MEDQDHYLKPRQAAAYTGIATSTLAKFRCLGRGPRYAKIGRAVLYRKSDLDTFMTSATVTSTSEVSAS